jgi:hypothetical protein
MHKNTVDHGLSYIYDLVSFSNVGCIVYSPNFTLTFWNIGSLLWNLSLKGKIVHETDHCFYCSG